MYTLERCAPRTYRLRYRDTTHAVITQFTNRYWYVQTSHNEGVWRATLASAVRYLHLMFCAPINYSRRVAMELRPADVPRYAGRSRDGGRAVERETLFVCEDAREAHRMSQRLSTLVDAYASRRQ